MSFQTERYKTCGDCGEEIAEWRRPHSHLCSKCGRARCRDCGQTVENMENTANGGQCVPCSIVEAGHEK